MSKMSEKAAIDMQAKVRKERIKKEYKSKTSHIKEPKIKKSNLQTHIYTGGIKRYVCEEPFWSRCIPYILIAIVLTIMACAIASEIMKGFK